MSIIHTNSKPVTALVVEIDSQETLLTRLQRCSSESEVSDVKSWVDMTAQLAMNDPLPVGIGGGAC
jgi:hypothetical protein